MKRIGILASGGGTTANYIATEVIGRNVSNVEIACVISSLSQAKVIGKMQALGIPTEVVRLKDFPDDALSFGQRILDIFEEHGVTDVFQWGWMPHTPPPNVVEAYEDHIYNAHPGPLPDAGGDKMAGKTVHDVVLRTRAKLLEAQSILIPRTFVVAHRVINEKDAGDVVQWGAVPILDGDTPDTLQERALPIEWRVQLGLVRDVAEDKVRANGHPQFVTGGAEDFLFEARREAVDAAAKH